MSGSERCLLCICQLFDALGDPSNTDNRQTTQAGTALDVDEAPAGIGRYRVGASDPISQKVAAELQDTASRGPAGGGKYVVTKSAITRAASAKMRAEVNAEISKSTSFWSGRGFLCCAAPTKVKE